MKHTNILKFLKRTALVCLTAAMMFIWQGVEAQAAEKQSYLSERYIQEYGLYEESMNDQFFFYVNVSNGGFTSDPVSFDIPANLSGVFERNGAPYTYTGSISQLGNYVIRFYGTVGDETYTSTFRFSIREAVEEPESESEPETQGIGDFEDIDEEDITMEDLENLDDEDISDEDIANMIESAGEELAEEEGYYEEADDYSLYGYSYEYHDGKYAITLATGDVAYCNVPLGAIVNEGVTIDVPENMQLIIYKDGIELTDVNAADYTYTIADDGFYKVEFNVDSIDYLNAYPEESGKPFIAFRIINSPTADIDYINAPLNCKIVKAGSKTFNILNDDGGKELYLDYYQMLEDNTYSFEMEDQISGKHYNVVIQRDTTAPEVYVTIEKGKAITTFKSSDTAAIELYKDGEKQVDTAVSKIAGRGVYKLIVTDKAGNVSELNFELKSYINAGTIIFAVMLAVMIAVGFCFVKLQKNRMRVR